MSDSIVITLFLNENADLEHVWIFYTMYMVVSLMYYISYDLIQSILYAGITLEIHFRLFEYLTNVKVAYLLRRRPTMTAI
jgi:hypothetical protein